MPLVVHTPEGKPGWEKIHCPVCGELCWKRPTDTGVIENSMRKTIREVLMIFVMAFVYMIAIATLLFLYYRMEGQLDIVWK